VNTSPPTITGTAQEGQTLSASSGTWSNSPASYSYQWRRCDSAGANCVGIAGAAAASYTVVAGDVGSTLQIVVTASNAGGSSAASSVQTSVVQSAPAPPPQTQTNTFSGSLNSKNPSLSYNVTAGTGLADARLSFNSKCGSLTLALKQGGTTVANATGPSVLVLSQALAAGTYSYVVSGSTRCSFTLTVTSPAPS
jgi:hypothetical protein